LNSVHKEHADAFAIANREGFIAFAAQPEMLHRMPMGGLLILLRVMLESE